MVLLAMGQWSLFLAAEDVSWLGLLLIPAATRACGRGWRWLGLRPMGTSQYAAMGPARGGYGAVLWVLLALSVGFPCGWTGASALWPPPWGTAWRCGTASGIWTACPGISPALP